MSERKRLRLDLIGGANGWERRPSTCLLRLQLLQGQWLADDLTANSGRVPTLGQSCDCLNLDNSMADHSTEWGK